IFDSRWDDALAWARQWFAAQGQSPQWTPALLVRLCDHKDPGAQRLGRELLTAHFELTDVTTYMLQLSQHPSSGMQLFVTNWLAAAAGGKPEVLARLEPYFLTVLSQANRGRLAKARVSEFLAAQAEQSEEAARIVARVFARQAVSGAITERARYVAGLRSIQQRYPALENPLQAAPGRRRRRSRRMKFQYRYFGHSGAQQTPTSTALQFAPDTLRAPVHFIGEVNRHLPFREGMSALHDVVVGDLRFQPRDKSAYLEWLASQEGELLAQYMA
ncbi:hypothetical protein ACEN8K_42015, partial [Variovorax sp. CT11-76]